MSKISDSTKLLVTIILALLSLVVSAWNGYSRNDKANAVEIAKLQTQQKNDQDAIVRVEVKVDKVDGKIDRVIDLMLRKP